MVDQAHIPAVGDEASARVLAPRRMMVLRYIAAHPGASSREIAAGLGAIDEGQLSKLLRRARELGYARSEQDGSTAARIPA